MDLIAGANGSANWLVASMMTCRRASSTGSGSGDVLSLADAAVALPDVDAMLSLVVLDDAFEGLRRELITEIS